MTAAYGSGTMYFFRKNISKCMLSSNITFFMVGKHLFSESKDFDNTLSSQSCTQNKLKINPVFHTQKAV